MDDIFFLRNVTLYTTTNTFTFSLLIPRRVIYMYNNLCWFLVYLFIVWSNYSSILLDRFARGFLQNNLHFAELSLYSSS